MSDQLPPTDLEAFTAAYMDACKDRPADWNDIGYWYARKMWDAAVRLERERTTRPVAVVDGVARFRENRIVSALLENSRSRGGYGLNEIAQGDFTAEERMELAQLIGYSVSGYGSLSYVTDESYYAAEAAANEAIRSRLADAQPKGKM